MWNVIAVNIIGSPLEIFNVDNEHLEVSWLSDSNSNVNDIPADKPENMEFPICRSLVPSLSIVDKTH